MSIKDIRLFSGGMDSDSDIRLIAPDDYIEGWNLISGVARKGAVTNVPGTTLIPYVLPVGNNTCIGRLRNIKENSIIYFIYNDLENHSILEYYCLTQSILPILEPSAVLSFTTEFLGFALDSKIHSANIVDDILTWTDNQVSPRKINKKSARAFLDQTAPSIDVFPYDNLIATGTFDQKIQFIELIKYKPFTEPDIELSFDSTRKTNYLQEKMVQSIYRYVYNDNEKSAWSDGSYVTLPEGEESSIGTYANSIANNYAIITLNTGHPTVIAMEIAVRFDNNGVWGRIDVPIRKYDDNNQRLLNDYTNYEYNFYNDGILIPLSGTGDNYDSVPQLCKGMDLIYGNRLALGNNVEGYQNPELNVRGEYIKTQVDMEAYSLFPAIRTVTTNMFTTGVVTIGVPPPYVQNNPTVTLREQVLIIPLDNSLIVPGTVISFNLRRTDCITFNQCGTYDETYLISYAVTENDLLNWPINFRQNLFDAISTAAYPVFLLQSGQVVDGIPVAFITTQDSFAFATEFTAITEAAVTLPTKKISSYKTGAFHPAGIIYKDIQGRDGGVVTNADMVVYVPYLPEIMAQDDLDNQFAYQMSLRFSIFHTPPEWAYFYEFVYATSDLLKYTQFLLKGVPQPINGNYVLDCSYIYDYITKERVITSVDFQFEPGDRLRFIANADKYVQTYVDAKVLSFDESTKKMTVIQYATSQITAGMTTASQEGTLVELYAKKRQADIENRVYFAIGETYPILNPGTAQRTHAGGLRNQNIVTGDPAITDLTRGDCYIFRRYFNSNSTAAMVESENFSDFYSSKNIDISATYAVINGKTRRYEGQIRYSGSYFPGTEINDLCHFEGSAYGEVDVRYGPVNKLLTIGYTLKVLQTKKITSFYINRRQTFNAQGESQLILTDQVLGDRNPSETDYGCAHPESVFPDARTMFFVDVNTGTVIRDDPNGMFPISSYKMVKFFNDLCKLIQNRPGVFICGESDNLNEMIHFTFNDTNASPVFEAFTISFSLTENRWKAKQRFIPEYYASNAQVFAAFKDGELWVFGNAIRNNFFGVQYKSEVTVVSNTDPLKIKTFESEAVYSNKVWDSPDIGDIEILPTVNYPQGMVSRLVAGKFRAKEGVLYADFLRDANTPNATSQQTALMEGRTLKGEAMIQRLENSDTEEVILFSIIIQSEPSELSK